MARPTARQPASGRPVAASAGSAPSVALVLVVAIYVALALAVALLTPPWEAADEADHVRNVQTLVEGDAYRIPEAGSPAARVLAAGYEPHQAPLYYFLLAGWQRGLGVDARPPTPVARSFVGPIIAPREGEPLFRHEGPGEAAADALVTRLRLPGILLGTVAVLLTWAAARRITADPWTPVIAAAVIASVPKFIFLSAVVTNDNLVNALGAAATFFAVSAAMRPAATRQGRVLMAAGLGVLLGGLLLAKVSSVLLGVGLGLAAFLSGRDRREGVVLVGVVGAVALAVGSWWLIRNSVWYGDPLAREAAQEYLRGLASPVADPLEQAVVNLPKGVWKSAWYNSGWNQFYWPWWAYVPFWGLALGSLTGFFRPASADLDPSQRRVVWVLGALALGGLATIWMVGMLTPQTQARVGFGALPAVGCLVALGLARLRMLRARFALPVLGFAATLFALLSDVVVVFH